VNLKRAWSHLLFAGRLKDETRKGAAKEAWKADLRAELGKRDDKTLDALTTRMQARYDEIEAVRASVHTRANALLLFVGIITTGAGIIAQGLVGAPPLLVGLFAVDGVLLLYATVGAAVLAVRAHLVGQSDTPWIEHEEATSERAVRVIYATEILVAADQNKVRLRRPVAFLASGQRYALAAIFLVAFLATLSVVAAVTKPAPAVVNPMASPTPAPSVPGPSPAPAQSPAVSATPSSVQTLPPSPSPT
jgi:hypothetical protein